LHLRLEGLRRQIGCNARSRSSRSAEGLVLEFDRMFGGEPKLTALIIALVIGAIAGWLAGLLVAMNPD